MTSDEEMTNMKVVRLEKLWNFVVNNFLIWNRLGSQTSKLYSDLYNMWGTERVYGHMWVCGAVVEEPPREAEVVGSNPTENVRFWVLRFCVLVIHSNKFQQNNNRMAGEFIILVHAWTMLPCIGDPEKESHIPTCLY
jgi:hypothetical protein